MRTPRINSHPLLWLPCLVSLLWFSCTFDSTIAGGSEIGNPAVVCGLVVDSAHARISGARVYLVDPSFNPATGDSLIVLPHPGLYRASSAAFDSANLLQTTTDSAGNFAIRQVRQGRYNLYIVDERTGSCRLQRSLYVGQPEVDLGLQQVLPSGVGIFNVGGSQFQPEGYLIVPGTPIRIAVTAPGEYRLAMPKDSINVFYFVPFVSTNKAVFIDSVRYYVGPGDTVDMTGIEPTLIAPMLRMAFGGDTSLLRQVDTINLTDTMVQLQAVGAYSDRGPIQYQFLLDTLTTAWSDSNWQFLYLMPGTVHNFACRIRSSYDSASTSAWTPQYALYVVGGVDTLPTLSAPDVPILADSITPIRDSVWIKCMTGGAVSSRGDTLQYRLGWTDSSGGGYSPWAFDTVVSIIVPIDSSIHEIRAQARSVVDTAVLSPWSQPLKILY
jgi:hypothetical protein